MTEWVSGNIFIREMRLDAVGTSSGGHKHNFDHTTVVFTGSVHVTKWVRRVHENGDVVIDDNGNEVWLMVTERDFEAPAHFLVEANARHDIVALAPNTVCWCVYSHRSPQGEVVQQFTGWGRAYV